MTPSTPYRLSESQVHPNVSPERGDYLRFEWEAQQAPALTARILFG